MDHASPTSMDDAEGSPDPLALDADSSLQVKQEELEDLHGKASDESARKQTIRHPKFYTEGEVSSSFLYLRKRSSSDGQLEILNTCLGPDKSSWDITIPNLESICVRMAEAGYKKRSAMGLRFK
jgi:hypothetical protein